jgi:DHA2 family multidrug resistance protein-like MFS transporter
MVAGVLIGIAFVRRQRRLEHPMLDLTLFRTAKFNAALGISVAGGVVMAGISLQAAIFLQVVEELTPFQAGLWLLPQSVAMILGLSLAPRIAQRVPTSTTAAIGLAISAVGLLVVTAGGMPAVITGLTITSFGMGMPMALTMNLMLAAAPPERAGSVASLAETSGEGGIALGVALLGSLGTVIYRGRLDVPANLSDNVAQQASESVSSAIGIAHQLSGQVGSDLATAAKSAFTSGLNVVALVGAAAFVAAALMAAVALRESPAEEKIPEQV